MGNRKLRVLVACEFSGAVRDAFRDLGHDAWSNDLWGQWPEGAWYDFHIYGDCRKVILEQGPWDILICHPPCTHLSVSGARWFGKKENLQQEALAFVLFLLEAPVEKIALENPVSIISSRIRKPDQIIQPWMFGDNESKTTCLWLKNLPRLKQTCSPSVFDTIATTTFHATPSDTRGKDRSRTFGGIARAMAKQWGGECAQKTV